MSRNFVAAPISIAVEWRALLVRIFPPTIRFVRSSTKTNFRRFKLLPWSEVAQFDEDIHHMNFRLRFSFVLFCWRNPRLFQSCGRFSLLGVFLAKILRHEVESGRIDSRLFLVSRLFDNAHRFFRMTNLAGRSNVIKIVCSLLFFPSFFLPFLLGALPSFRTLSCFMFDGLYVIAIGSGKSLVRH